MIRVTITMAIMCWLPGCGGASPSPPPGPPAENARVSARRAQEVATIGCISRPLLIAVLDKGLGHFLRGVRTEPEMTQGRFRGFRIVELYPRDPMFQHKSPRAGDIVTTVNGQPIARPEQAVKVWESLRVASELRIAFVRDGNEDEARYRIVD